MPKAGHASGRAVAEEAMREVTARGEDS